MNRIGDGTTPGNALTHKPAQRHTDGSVQVRDDVGEGRSVELDNDVSGGSAAEAVEPVKDADDGHRGRGVIVGRAAGEVAAAAAAAQPALGGNDLLYRRR